MVGTSVHPMMMMMGSFARQAYASQCLIRVVPDVASLNFYWMILNAGKTCPRSVLNPLELGDFSVLSAFVPSVLPLATLLRSLVRHLRPPPPLVSLDPSTLLLFRSNLCRRMSYLVKMVCLASLAEMRCVDLRVPASSATCLLGAGALMVPVRRMSSLWVIRTPHFWLGRKTPFRIGSDLEHC